MPPLPASRRAFGAGLGSLLLLGAVASRAAPTGGTGAAQVRLAALAEDYYRSWSALFPLEATEMDGDPAYEAALAIDIAPRHRERQRRLYQRTLARLGGIERSQSMRAGSSPTTCWRTKRSRGSRDWRCHGT